MKKLITTITILLFAFSFAQLSYGVKAGYTNSKMRFDEEDLEIKFDSRSSFYIGGFVERKISEKLSLQGELQYTELGGKKSFEVTKLVGTEVVVEGVANIKYINRQIQMPILAKYYLDPKFSILGGINLGVSISGKFKTDFVSDTLQNENVENYRTLTVFPVIGTEFLFYQNFFAEARYNFGLFDAAKSNALNTYFNTFQIGLGYKF